MSYSPFFHTLYDEVAPVGHLGRGTHYSVLRVPTWHDNNLRVLPRASLLDFATIWDEDHDVRVINAVQQMYFEGLLAPVRFVGERKGCFTVLLDPEIRAGWGASSLRAYAKRVEDSLETGDEDSWTCAVEFVGEREHSIINDKFADVSLYLENIQMLWRLGMKPYSRAATDSPVADLVTTPG